MSVRRDKLVDKLRTIILKLTPTAIEELIKLLEAPKDFEALTPRQIWDVGNYYAIRIGGTSYFTRAFSTAKEAADVLRLTKESLGREIVLRELKNAQKEVEEASRSL